jgi:hypothetical protein
MTTYYEMFHPRAELYELRQIVAHLANWKIRLLLFGMRVIFFLDRMQTMFERWASPNVEDI